MWRALLKRLLILPTCASTIEEYSACTSQCHASIYCVLVTSCDVGGWSVNSDLPDQKLQRTMSKTIVHPSFLARSWLPGAQKPRQAAKKAFFGQVCGVGTETSTFFSVDESVSKKGTTELQRTPSRN